MNKNIFAKKIFSIVLAVCMLLSNAVIVSVGATDVETVEYTVIGEFSNCGKQLDVTVKMDNNVSGLWCSMFIMDFNADALKPIDGSIANGDVWSARYASLDLSILPLDHNSTWARGKVYVAFTGNETENATTVKSGTVVTMSFEVLDPSKPLNLEYKTWSTAPVYAPEETNHCKISADGEGVPVPFNVYYDVPVLEAPAYGHTAVVIPGYAATCEDTGLEDKLVCSVCEEVLVDHVEIPALGHNEVEIPAVAPTCTEIGYTAGSKCSVCDKILAAPEEIEALGHTEEEIAAVAPSCTETGLTVGSKCTVCGVTTVEQTVVEALGHNETELSAVDATCEATGLTAGLKCTVCGEITVKQEIIPLQEHVPENADEWIVESEATETEDGLKYQTCKWCGLRINDTVIPSFNTVFTVTVVDSGKTYELNHKAGEAVNISADCLIYLTAVNQGYVLSGWTVEGADEYSEVSEGKGADKAYSLSFTMPANNVTVTVKRYLHGDVDANGKLTALDILALLKSMKVSAFTPAHDTNFDGKVTALDKLTWYKILKGSFDYSEYVYDI